MDDCIVGIGTAVPEYEIEQADAAEQASQLCCATGANQRLVKALYRRAGVLRRRSVVLNSSTNGHPAEQSFYAPERRSPRGPTTAERMQMYELFAAPLAIRAAREALRDAEVEGSAVTHIVTVSCSGFSSPGVDLAMIRELALRMDVSRTHIGFMGCHGALNGLRVAKAFAQSSRGCVLLCAVELCTLHHQYGWQPDQIVANSLFADGAATVVVRADKSRSESELQLTDLRSTVIPDSSDLMRWRIDDHGFQMNLSPRVPAVIKGALRPWLENWLGEHGLKIDDIGSWAIHPGGPRIVEACAKAIAIRNDCTSDSLEILAEYGNMSSPTVLFILDRLRRRDAPRPYLAIAFGPGIAVEAALLS